MRSQLLSISFAAAIIASPSMFAADSGGYVGASIGGSTAKDAASAAELDAQNALDGFTTTSSVDDTDTAWKVFGGYKFNRNFAVEGSYVDFGEVAADSVVSASSFGTGTYNQTIASSAFGVAALGILPLPYNFEIFGKAGLHYWSAEWDANLNLTGLSGSVNEDDSGTNFFYGIGAGYSIIDSVAVRAEWERYNNIGDENTTGESDVDMWSVGVQYTF